MVSIQTDLSHGGRWTSLRAGGREWLWHRGGVDRDSVRPGDPFVDAGGLEECIPTVRGVPDHGAAWSRPWNRGHVNCGDFQLWRRISADGAAYRLEASPGYRFVWAAHALLDVSPAAVLEAPAGTLTRIDGGEVASWPTPLAALGPDDGTAVGAVLVDCPSVAVSDGSRLSFRLEAPGQPVSVGFWRNLRGWPVGDPYRSIGVEPMLGRVFDLSLAGPGDAAVVPASGICEWRLRVSAS